MAVCESWFLEKARLRGRFVAFTGGRAGVGLTSFLLLSQPGSPTLSLLILLILPASVPQSNLSYSLHHVTKGGERDQCDRNVKSETVHELSYGGISLGVSRTSLSFNFLIAIELVMQKILQIINAVL